MCSFVHNVCCVCNDVYRCVNTVASRRQRYNATCRVNKILIYEILLATTNLGFSTTTKAPTINTATCVLKYPLFHFCPPLLQLAHMSAWLLPLMHHNYTHTHTKHLCAA